MSLMDLGGSETHLAAFQFTLMAHNNIDGTRSLNLSDMLVFFIKNKRDMQTVCLEGLPDICPFNGFLCRFLGFPLLRSIPSGKTANKTKSAFHACPTAAKPRFYDSIVPRGAQFRPLPKFLSEFVRVTTNKLHMAISFQFSNLCFGALLSAEKVAISILSLGFAVL